MGVENSTLTPEITIISTSGGEWLWDEAQGCLRGEGRLNGTKKALLSDLSHILNTLAGCVRRCDYLQKLLHNASNSRGIWHTFLLAQYLQRLLACIATARCCSPLSLCCVPMCAHGAPGMSLLCLTLENTFPSTWINWPKVAGIFLSFLYLSVFLN